MGIAEANAWSIGLAMGFMLMDILTGFIGSVITHTFSSSKMREGLGHKVLLICIMAMAVMLEIGGEHIEGLGFTSVTVPVVCVYIIIMEVGSVLENVCAAYPELKDTPLFKLFKGKDSDNA